MTNETQIQINGKSYQIAEEGIAKDGRKQYVLAGKRGARAAHTLVDMLPPLKKGQTDNPAMLLDAAFMLFPRGFDSRGSQVLDTFAARFLTACRAQRAQPLRLDWIAMTRGRDCAAWYAEHVEPRLT